MRARTDLRPRRENPRLLTRQVGERRELWTQTTGALPEVYGERWREARGESYRVFEPNRSKLAAAVERGWTGVFPQVGERWLYLGAASGTTASHVADLLGPSGRVYAVEKSVRPFARLYALSERWPNLLPILADARSPTEYFDLVPAVDGVYADIAQPDQLDIVRRNATLYLRGAGAAVLIALKASSMGRERSPAQHLGESERLLERVLTLDESVRLDPFHRAHYLLGGRVRRDLFHDEARETPVRTPPGHSPARRRR